MADGVVSDELSENMKVVTAPASDGVRPNRALHDAVEARFQCQYKAGFFGTLGGACSAQEKEVKTLLSRAGAPKI